MATAAASTTTSAAVLAFRLLRRLPRRLSVSRAPPAALASSSSSSSRRLPSLARHPLGHRTRMGHTAAAAAAAAEPALGLTKPNAVEPPQVCHLCNLACVPASG
jgi:leucyl aminopeptidase